jgi:hypothetical protein
MAEQYLHRAQVTCLLVNDGRLGSPKRMGSVVFPAQSNRSDPFVDESSILPRADMIGVIDPTWKDEVVERAAAAFEPCQNTAASGFKEFELNGAPGLLLNDDCARANPAAADEIADLNFNDVASPELTVELWLNLGDGVNQAADLASGATSIPSWNLTPWMTFGNWF